jgi:hypothetical protein
MRHPKPILSTLFAAGFARPCLARCLSLGTKIFQLIVWDPYGPSNKERPLHNAKDGLFVASVRVSDNLFEVLMKFREIILHAAALGCADIGAPESFFRRSVDETRLPKSATVSTPMGMPLHICSNSKKLFFPH